jgi:hypothetical protein
MSDLPRHPRTGVEVLPEVFADPGRRGFYYREQMPDSVMRYIPAKQAEAEIERLRSILREAIPFIGYQAHVPDIVKRAEDAIESKEAGE